MTWECKPDQVPETNVDQFLDGTRSPRWTPPQLLKDAVESLWKNWAFRLSLSSNELFHSNILQFLAETCGASSSTAPTLPPVDICRADDCFDEVTSPLLRERKSVGERASRAPEPSLITPGQARALLTLLSTDVPAGLVEELDNEESLGNTLTIRREWNNLDLAVLRKRRNGRGSEAIFAVEVKVKSYPTRSQLETYVQKLRIDREDRTVRLFLLTAMGEKIADDLDVSPVGFDVIAEQLMALAPKFTLEIRPIVDKYCDLCKCIVSLSRALEAVLERPLEDILACESFLRPYRLHSLWGKLWASRLDQLCRAHTSSLSPQPSHDSGFTRTGVATASWTEGRAADKEYLSLGVQVEGDSLRLFLNLADPDLGDRNMARRRAEYAVLQLCAKKGLFATNPRLTDYIDRWRAMDAREAELPSNSWEGIKLGTTAQNEYAQHIAADGDWGRSKTYRPRLHGYANKDGNGHGDFRLRILPGATLKCIAEMMGEILVKNLFSDRSAQLPSILQEIVLDYRNDPKGWNQEWSQLPTGV